MSVEIKIAKWKEWGRLGSWFVGCEDVSGLVGLVILRRFLLSLASDWEKTQRLEGWDEGIQTKKRKKLFERTDSLVPWGSL